LREALTAAGTNAAVDGCSAGSGADVVHLPAGSFTVNGGFAVGDDVTLRGVGPATRIVATQVRLDHGTAVLEDLAVEGAVNGAIDALNGDLTLRRVSLLDNAGTVAAAVAMRFDNSGARPRLLIVDSSVDGNHGAPAVIVAAGSVEVRRTTFSHNVGTAAGGALVARGDAGDVVVLQDSTFSDNASGSSGGAASLFVTAHIESCTFADNGAAVEGGALFASVAPTIRNSLFTHNEAPDGPSCKQTDAVSVSRGFNTFDDDTGCTMREGSDARVTEDIVGPLAHNGGLGLTHMPLLAGAADNTGSCIDGAGVAVEVDARGASRLDGECDRGAVERAGRFLETLVEAHTEAPGAACAQGGHRVDVGVDDGAGDLTLAGNHALDDVEVGSSVFLCTTETAAELVSVESDVTCPNGGVKIHSGVDDDGDGRLSAAERDNTQRFCQPSTGAPGPSGAPGADGVDGERGNAGASSLLRVTGIDAGDSGCPAGGQRIDAGVDDGAGGSTAGDGILSDGEVDSTAIVCNGKAFEDDFAATGGPSCASTGTAWSTQWAFVLGLLLRRRRAHR
jgi:hypothetical protein